MKYVLSSPTLPKECESTLKSLGFTPIYLPPWDRLQKGVASHPDMLLFLFGTKYIVSKEYYDIAKNELGLLSSIGYTPIFTDEIPSPEYPNDILFNSLLLDNNIIGLEKHMSSKIRELGNNIINVRQGYAKCSSFKLTDNAIITSDRGIASAAQSIGADVLLISEGGIELSGYSHGFIGGAGGVTDNTAYFCGDVNLHPDSKKIKDFCKKHKKECVSLSKEPLFDLGTLFFV